MKKSFWQIIMGSAALLVGFTSCKKDKNCTDNCATVAASNGFKNTFCVGDDGMTQEEFNIDVAYYRAMEGYTVAVTQKCD